MLRFIPRNVKALWRTFRKEFQRYGAKLGTCVNANDSSAIFEKFYKRFLHRKSAFVERSEKARCTGNGCAVHRVQAALDAVCEEAIF
jgi:hypothetical protein